MKKSTVLFLFFGALLSGTSAYGQEKVQSEEIPEVFDPIVSSQSPSCDQGANPAAVCVCIDSLVANSWSDDPDTDMLSILAKSQEDYSQASIDLLIEFAQQTDDQCFK